MIDQDGTGAGTERPRWGGFPGGAEQQQPTAPQFPLAPLDDLTAPIPLVESANQPPPPARPRGSHRAAKPAAAERDGHTWMRYLTIGGLSAVAVVAALYGFASCVSTDDVIVPTVPAVATSSSPAAPTGSVSPTASGSAAPSASASQSTSASPSTSAGSTNAASTPKASASASSTAKATPKTTKTAKPKPTKVVGVKQPVVVLNSTGITGLAKRIAADITAGGWSVPETANWRGASPAVTTIYYLPGAKNKASAQLFAKKFDVAAAVKPALRGMTSPLVLVLARDSA